MMLRPLIAATTLLAAACFVDNRPVGASASVASTSDDSTSDASSTGPGTAAGTAPGTGTSLPTTGGDASTGTGGAPDDTSTGTTDPGTTDPGTTNPGTTEPFSRCSGLAQLGGAVSLGTCSACVMTHCCEPFDECAASETCVGAWSCVNAEPCESEWINCPGIAESFSQMQQISECVMGPCAEVCLIPCAAQTLACDNSKACNNLEACAAACVKECAASDFKCAQACSNWCVEMFPGGDELLQAKTACLNAEC